MARYLILDKTNKVTNAIEWDGIAKFDPPRNCILRLELNKGNPGDIFDGRNFITPAKEKSFEELRQEEFQNEIKAVDDDPTTTGIFQRFITATRNKFGF